MPIVDSAELKLDRLNVPITAPLTALDQRPRAKATSLEEVANGAAIYPSRQARGSRSFPGWG
jgi:hypothetical protein